MLTIFEETIDSAPMKLLLRVGDSLLLVVAIIALGFVANAIMNRLIRRLSASWRERGHDRKANTLATVLHSLSRYTIVFIVVCAVLGVFHIPITSILTVAGVGSVALGFGAQSLVKDFITGFFLLLEDQFGVGDLVTLVGKTGTVEAIGMRTTRIRGLDGEVHILPNSQILFVTNLSGSYRHAIVDLSADSNVISILGDEMRAAAEHTPLLTAEPTVVVMTGAGHFRIIANCRVGENAAVENEIKRLIQERFEREGIAYSIR